MRTLYLIRHGIAVDLGEQGVSRDEDRPLSERGRQRTRLAARGWLGWVDPPPASVLSSPLVRAMETARIFCEESSTPPSLDVCAALAPGGARRAVLAAVHACPPGPVALVGHMPGMAELVSWFLTGGEGLELRFRKAAVCGLTGETPLRPGELVLEWFLPPSVLRRLS